MISSHEFARQLLNGPDVPIVTLDFAARTPSEAIVDPQVAPFSWIDRTTGVAVFKLEIFGTSPVLGAGPNNTKKR